MNRKHIVYNAATLMLMVSVMMCLYGCTTSDLDLCHGEHPHRGELVVEYNWSNMGAEHPDSMVVMALRPVFRDKMASIWAADVAPGESRRYGRFIASATENDTLYYAKQNNNPFRHYLYLPAGEWEISSYTFNRETENKAIEYTQEVMDGGDNLLYKTSIQNSLPNQYTYWHNRNPRASWINASKSESVCLATGKVVVDEYASAKKNYKVVLTPQVMSQKVNINFDTQIVGEDIVIDSIVCAVGGIADAMKMVTTELKTDVLHHAVYKAELTYVQNRVVKTRGTIYVPGLMCSSNPSSIQGTGILQTSIFVHFVDADNIRHQRRLDAALNLHRLLTQTPSIKTDEKGRLVQARRELTLNVHGALQIFENQLYSTDGAKDCWVDQTNMKVEGRAQDL